MKGDLIFMSGRKITWIVIGVVALALVLSAIGGYNGLVSLNEDVSNKLSQIDNQLQLRNDLIPNLVATVKGFAVHEEEILKNVSDARAKLAGASDVGQMAEGDAELTGALSRLPDLKADANFRQLSDNLSGTENRISVARRDYNESATRYNTAIRRFPTNIMAGIFGFDKVEYFKAQEGAQEVPKVDFSE